MIRPQEADEFLDHHRIAVVGVSEAPKNFARTVWLEMLKRGYDALAVNTGLDSVNDLPCYRNLSAIPGEIEGVIVMVPGDGANTVVADAIARGIKRIWLFQGIGGPGAVTDEAVALCRANNVTVIAGACPLMFLEPTSPIHKVHRTMRRLNGSLAKATS
ncbi:MAG: CoA-binding protein [Acidimicrobiia bacterium]|nr:CoA-binding protein [Acidimicrobiia bacterium]